jgi:hypothetical protein
MFVMFRMMIVGGLFVAIVGCSSDTRQSTYSVTGQVMLDEKPLKGAVVVLHPLDKSKFKMDERPQATTDADGKFTLFTYVVGDGAPAGEYQVAIAVVDSGDQESGDDQFKHQRLTRVPAHYGYAEKSGLKATVLQQPTTLDPFRLKSK